MTTKTKLERLAEHYDHTDTAEDLEKATVAASAEPGSTERMTTFAVPLPVAVLECVREIAEERHLGPHPSLDRRRHR